MSRAVHYLEREARELEEAYLAEISAGYYALVRRPPVEPTPLPEILAEILEEIRSAPPVSEIPDGRCHRGLRAPRLVKDMADLAAYPELFRCGDCGMLLDAPLKENREATAHPAARAVASPNRQEGV